MNLNTIASGTAIVSLTTARNNQSLVRELQQRLTTLGFQPGPIDGIWGNRTQSAFTAFITRNQLKANEISPRTAQLLLGIQPRPATPTPAPRPTPAPTPTNPAILQPSHSPTAYNLNADSRADPSTARNFNADPSTHTDSYTSPIPCSNWTSICSTDPSHPNRTARDRFRGFHLANEPNQCRSAFDSSNSARTRCNGTQSRSDRWTLGR
ncbi:peptidoglycan-binding protein [Leptolyngbya sp. NIES-3755]|nr:peptidoglycan-binding protein [Leptolyngbya sp. NIES-3755]